LNTERQQALEIRILIGFIAKTVRQATEQYMAEKGVSLSMLQFGILHLASHHNFCTSADMSKQMMLDPSTLVPAVDGLVEKGLLVKERDPHDRRRHLLQLTEEGQAIMRELNFVNDNDPVLRALEELGVEDSELLLNLLRKVVETLPEGSSIATEIHERIKQYTIHRKI
jgi:DNA-binding MarR family transcriptional regulator